LYSKKIIFGFLLGGIVACQALANEGGARLVLNFNQGWRFERTDASTPVTTQSFFDPKINDETWELVNVPHTVRLEPWNASGGQNFQGICWYRKHFTVEDGWKGKKLFLRFDGAMQVADVWLNGKRITRHYGGYLPFVLDITDQVQFGSDNVLALRLDNSNQPLVPPGKPQENLDFAYFGGLYRDVYFVVTDRLHVTDPILADKVAGGGIFVTYPSVDAQNATVQVKTEVKNEQATPKNCAVKQELLDANGTVVASASSSEKIEAGADHTFAQTFQVAQPKLWHPNHPNLYSLRTQIYDGDTPVDEVTTRIGIRTFEFRPDGLFINGERFFSTGFNHHQDYPYIGYAVPDSLQYNDIKKLREAGLTSFRSHYPHSPAFMDACDELGVLTIVSTPGWQYFTNDPYFLDRSYQDTREMIRWNRNRPSVILWEVGLNESDYSQEYAKTVQGIVHEEYPFNPCYTAGDGYQAWQNADPVFDVLYHDTTAKPSGHPLWWREFGDAWDLNWGDQIADNRVARGWGEAAMLLQARRHEESLRAVMESDPSYTGCDLWAGIDCDRGYHPMPFLGGILDKGRLPKFSYYMFASQRPADLHVPGLDDGPMVFIASLMTHYSSRDVTVFCNCEEVQLWKKYDGKADELIGTQKVVNDGKVPHAPLVFTNAIGKMDRWRLKAEGLIGGKVVAEYSIGAAGVARKLDLQVDKCGRELVADGSDIVVIHACIEDKNGNVVPFDDRSIFFSISGSGKIIGDASIEANPTRSELGIATLLVQSTSAPGRIIVQAHGQGLSIGRIEFESIMSNQHVVEGRDVRLEQNTASVAGIMSGTPARLPDAQVMEQQQKSEELRSGENHK
jgi:beta-galactosidase